MSELQAITTGLASVKTAIDIVKTLKNIDHSYDLAELKLKTVELMDQLVDVKEKMLDIKEENIQLKERITGLENAIALEDEMTFDGKFYWKGDESEKRDGPYCQSCKDGRGKLIRLQDMGVSAFYVGNRVWKCTVCGTNYDVEVNS